jgi:hypothetical protein
MVIRAGRGSTGTVRAGRAGEGGESADQGGARHRRRDDGQDGAVRRIAIQERRARLGLRHHLAPAARAGGPVEVADHLAGLHGTDPASVYLAIRARADVKASDIERALYDERALVRMLGMRRTVFTVPVEQAGIIQAACARAIAVRERRNLVQLLDGAGLAGAGVPAAGAGVPAGGAGPGPSADVGAWLADIERSTLRALTARGEATAAELAGDEPRLREPVLMAAGKPYQAWQNIATRVLSLLAVDGHIVRGRPRGSWVSSQYRWSPVTAWLPGGLPEWPAESARVELARRWLAAFGPGTAADLKWWAGWTMTETRKALAGLATVEVDLGGVTGLVLAGDEESVAEPGPWVALLPALDPTAMGWAARDWYVGPHTAAIFDRSGNIGPTVWCDGRIVGGWAQRGGGGGEIAYRLLEDVGAEAAAEVAAEAGRLADWIGQVRVTPRFRTPLERELSA